MRRRDVVLAFMAAAASACAPAPRALPASPDFVIATAAERTLAALPDDPLYWRIETMHSLEAAQSAASATSLAAEISGRVWLVTLGQPDGRTPGATHVAQIGPIPRIEAQRYLLRLNHAHAPPGTATAVHTHPGTEAFYVLEGQLSQRTPHGVARIDAGEGMNGHGPGTVMQLQSTGTVDLDQLVLFVVDADQPFSSPATFPE